MLEFRCQLSDHFCWLLIKTVLQALVTALATGAAKGLVEISITNNQIGEMGQRMLDGVKFMRKGMTIQSASSIDNIAPKAS